MAKVLSGLFGCLCGADTADEKRSLLEKSRKGSGEGNSHPHVRALSSYLPFEERPRMTWSDAVRAKKVDQTATAIVQRISRHNAYGDSQSLNYVIENEVTAYGGWDEWLAKSVLDKFVELVQNGDHESWGESFARAMKKVNEVKDEIFQWAEDHPLLASAIVFVIVFGILELMCPWVLGILGFGELGPIEASWAARWQSLYGGCVPKGSLFSYLQRLGMIRKSWGWA